jgi:hypothetical protein
MRADGMAAFGSLRPGRAPGDRRWRALLAGTAVSAAALGWAATASAHDYWMVPNPLVAPGEQEQITVSLFVGEDFVAEAEQPFEAARIPRLLHVRTAEGADLLPSAVEGATPMLRVRLAGSGGHLIALDRNLAKIELPAEKFEDYLHHEGLAQVTAERARRGESSKPGRERYTRCLKALVQLGDARDDAFAKVVGQTLELVPDSHPAFVAPGEKLPIRVLFHGAPLPKARVEAFSREGTGVRGAELTTDDRGLVEIPIDRRGVWLVRMAHMVRCEGCPDADWESTWASYVFASAPPGRGVVIAPPMLAPKAAPESDGFMSRLWIGVAAAVALAASLGALLVERRKRRERAT